MPKIPEVERPGFVQPDPGPGPAPSRAGQIIAQAGVEAATAVGNFTSHQIVKHQRAKTADFLASETAGLEFEIADNLSTLMENDPDNAFRLHKEFVKNRFKEIQEKAPTEAARIKSKATMQSIFDFSLLKAKGFDRDRQQKQYLKSIEDSMKATERDQNFNPDAEKAISSLQLRIETLNEGLGSRLSKLTHEEKVEEYTKRASRSWLFGYVSGRKDIPKMREGMALIMAGLGMDPKKLKDRQLADLGLNRDLFRGVIGGDSANNQLPPITSRQKAAAKKLMKNVEPQDLFRVVNLIRNNIENKQTQDKSKVNAFMRKYSLLENKDTSEARALKDEALKLIDVAHRNDPDLRIDKRMDLFRWEALSVAKNKVDNAPNGQEAAVLQSAINDYRTQLGTKAKEEGANPAFIKALDQLATQDVKNMIANATIDKVKRQVGDPGGFSRAQSPDVAAAEDAASGVDEKTGEFTLLTKLDDAVEAQRTYARSKNFPVAHSLSNQKLDEIETFLLNPSRDVAANFLTQMRENVENSQEVFSMIARRKPHLAAYWYASNMNQADQLETIEAIRAAPTIMKELKEGADGQRILRQTTDAVDTEFEDYFADLRATLPVEVATREIAAIRSVATVESVLRQRKDNLDPVTATQLIDSKYQQTTHRVSAGNAILRIPKKIGPHQLNAGTEHIENYFEAVTDPDVFIATYKDNLHVPEGVIKDYNRLGITDMNEIRERHVNAVADGLEVGYGLDRNEYGLRWNDGTNKLLLEVDMPDGTTRPITKDFALIDKQVPDVVRAVNLQEDIIEKERVEFQERAQEDIRGIRGRPREEVQPKLTEEQREALFRSKETRFDF